MRLRRYDINDEIRLIDTQGFDRQNSEAYDINCWQTFEGETLEMWPIRYGRRRLLPLLSAERIATDDKR